MDDTKKPDTVPGKNVETQQLITGKFNPELRDKIKALHNTYISGERKLFLHFPLQKEPTVVEIKDSITLGRSDLRAGINPTVDLTVHNGALLGVSRFHAEITLVNGTFHIKDMGSTNGTRINDTKIPAYRLIPFRNGDTLRLGHLNIIVS